MLFLMISLIIGDIFDAFDLDVDFDTDVDLDVDADFDRSGGSGVGIFDSRVISVFLTAFGFIGAIALKFGFGAIVSSIFGIGSGILIGRIYLCIRILFASQEATVR